MIRFVESTHERPACAGANAPTSLALADCAFERDRDAPWPTQDGIIWPRERHEMTDANAIRARMAGDLNDLRREDGGASFNALRDKGWKADQISGHLPGAAELAERLWSETRTPVSDLVGAVMGFASFVALIGGLLVLYCLACPLPVFAAEAGPLIAPDDELFVLLFAAAIILSPIVALPIAMLWHWIAAPGKMRVQP